jgi:hypothetical protein
MQNVCVGFGDFEQRRANVRNVAAVSDADVDLDAHFQRRLRMVHDSFGDEPAVRNDERNFVARDDARGA